MGPERTPIRKTLWYLLGPRVASLAGFEPGKLGQSSRVKREGDPFARYYLHLGFIPNFNVRENGLHLVVGEKITGRRQGWYVEAFEGPSWKSMAGEEQQKYLQMVEEVFRPKNNVPARQLEGRVLLAIDTHRRK